VHADAGRSASDVQARMREFGQLAQFIDTLGPEVPVVVAGDTNLEESSVEDSAILRKFLRHTRLREVSRRAGAAGAGVDRVFVRDSTRVSLQLSSVHEDTRFVGNDGEPLSDHPALAVVLQWRLDERLAQRRPFRPKGLRRSLAANATR